MADWSAGYVADIGYTHGYYHELNPLRIKLAFLHSGLACPDVGTACELGFGQGLSTNIHAAATLTRWYGTDFNPSQAAQACEMAEAAGSGAQLFDDAFAEFANRPGLPDFDFIGVHGIWSWVSDENRRTIVDFIRRKLKVGGVLYISYNTQPGWASFAPMRHLLTAHAASQGAEGRGIVNQIEGALTFGKELLALHPRYASTDPGIAKRFEQLGAQNRSYLAHEYFNRDWHPMHFSTMGEWLDPAKLQYACSANYSDHFDNLNMSEEQKVFLQNIPDRMFRETVRDFMVNQTFRRDYWVKGARVLSPLEVSELIGKIRVILVKHRSAFTYQIQMDGGMVELSETIYRPLLDLLADYQPRTLKEIADTLAPHGVKFNQVIEAAMLLSRIGQLAAAQDAKVVSERQAVTARLNDYIEGKARSGADISYVASPVTGGGIMLGRFNALFAKAIGEGLEDVDALANYVWNILQAQGQCLIVKGERLMEPAENIAELKRNAQDFLEKQMPVLRALKVM